MIEITKGNTARAIERCKQVKPKVRFIADRVYNVESARNPNLYQVKFAVADGKKLAECNCNASERGLICYHIAAAAAVNIMRQSIKRQYA